MMKKYENPIIEVVEVAIDEIMNASVATVQFNELGQANDFNWKV